MYVTISEHLPKVVNMPEENEKCAKEMCTYKHMHVSIQSFIYVYRYNDQFTWHDGTILAYEFEMAMCAPKQTVYVSYKPRIVSKLSLPTDPARSTKSMHLSPISMLLLNTEATVISAMK